MLEANGRMNNYFGWSARVTPRSTARCIRTPTVYKWTEAVGFALQSGDRPECMR